ncbi:hypothetical protein V8C42DRAFT_329260 [Trichoderma barbatum]
MFAYKWSYMRLPMTPIFTQLCAAVHLKLATLYIEALTSRRQSITCSAVRIESCGIRSRTTLALEAGSGLSFCAWNPQLGAFVDAKANDNAHTI